MTYYNNKENSTMNNKTKGKRYVGLTQAEVEASRRQHGENLLTPPKRTPIWKLYL